MAILDVPASNLIEKAASELSKKIDKPAWADYVKSSVNRERSPDRRDWIYVRMASILYRLYVDGPQGVGSLRNYYGGKQRRGASRPHFRKASGKAIRFCMQALEKEGLVEKAKPKGRQLSPKGQSFLDRISKEVKMSMPKRHNESTVPAKSKEENLHEHKQAANETPENRSNLQKHMHEQKKAEEIKAAEEK